MIRSYLFCVTRHFGNKPFWQPDISVTGYFGSQEKISKDLHEF